MAGFLHALKTAAVREITIGGGEWRIRRVSSADLARASISSLTILPVDVLATAAKEMVNGEGDVDLEAIARKAIKGFDPDQAAKASDLADGMVCAGVTHVRAVGAEEWEPVRFTLDRAKGDAPECMWVGDLTQDIRAGLARAVREHTTEDGEAVERLTSFRTGT